MLGVVEPEALGSQCPSYNVVRQRCDESLGGDARGKRSQSYAKFCLSGEREFLKGLLLFMPMSAQPYYLFSFGSDDIS